MKVGVVGAGVGGLAAAALLGRIGHDVTLLERAPVLHPVGAGVLLQRSGQLVLERLGLLREIESGAERIERLSATTQYGRPLLRLPLSVDGTALHALGVHRGDLHGALARLAAEVGVDVLTGVEVVAVEDGTAHASSGAMHGPFDLVIAADGSRSRLREQSGLVRFSHAYGHGALWTVGQAPAVRAQLEQTVRGTRELIGLLPLGSGRCAFFAGVEIAALDRLRAAGFSDWRDRVLSLAPRAEPILAPLERFDELTVATYRHVVLHRPFTGPLVLIGDAAHSMSPHLGQGVNLALVDAWELAAALERSSTVDAALRSYAETRRGHLRYYGLITMLLSPFFQSSGTVLGMLRDLGLPVLWRLPPSRRRMALAAAGLATGISMRQLRLTERLDAGADR